MKQAVGYARVSSDEQRNEGHSLDYQISRIKQRATEYNILNIFSGSESAFKTGRKLFNEMISFINQQKGTIYLIVAKPDRLSRNQFDEAMIQGLVSIGKIIVHYIEDNKIIDANTSPSELMMVELQGMQARYEVRNQSVRIKSGNQGALEKGFTLKPPYGYANLDKNNPSDKIRKPHPTKAPFVQTAFELYATGNYSLSDLREALYKRGFIYLPSSPKCSTSQLATILNNRFYYGWHPVTTTGKQIPLISQVLFQRVQQVLRGKTHPKKNKHAFPFNGLLTCDSCKMSFCGELKRKPSGKTYTYYRCGGNRKRTCKAKSINEEKLYSAVTTMLESIQMTPAFKADFLHHAKKHQISVIEYNRSEKSRLEGLITRAEGLRGKALSHLMDEVITKDEYEAYRNTQQIKIDSYQLELAKIHESDKDLFKQASHLVELPEMVATAWKHGTDEEKQSILKVVIANSVIKSGNIHLELKPVLTGLTKQAQIKKWWRSPDKWRTFITENCYDLQLIEGLVS